MGDAESNRLEADRRHQRWGGDDVPGDPGESNLGSDIDVERLCRDAAAVIAGHDAIAAAYLFGSVARGDARPGSDVDYALIMRRRVESAADCTDTLLGLASELERLTAPRTIDLVILELQGPLVVQSVLEHGRLIYDEDRERRIDIETDMLVRALDFRPTYEIGRELLVPAFRRQLRDTSR